MLKQRVAFLEVPDGYRGAARSDNAGLGYRKDTLPMVEELRKKGWEADVLFYTHEHSEFIRDYLIENVDAYISRINPGNLEDEPAYFDVLREVEAGGVFGLPGPDQMVQTGAKDALVHLIGSNFVLDDTFAYYDAASLAEQFPKSLAIGERVLKQNRGSTGEGIWRVQTVNPVPPGTETLPMDTPIRCTEAKDNHVEYHQLGEFLQFCEQYVVGADGLLLDQRFLPRIKEGEVRILMLDDKPINVVHKKPADAEDAFSATLFSGATYRYDPPGEWSELVDPFVDELDTINAKLGTFDGLPLIWTADFILDTNADGSDRYILGEMNCSCVGFTSQLELAPVVADTVIAMVTKRKV